MGDNGKFADIENVIKWAGKTHYGHNVQLCREIRGIKQPDLAKLLNISTRTMARYESQEKLSDTILAKISNVLNFSVEFMKELNSGSDLKIQHVNEGGKVFEDNAKDESKNTFGIPVENYDNVYKMYMEEKEKNIKLEIENKILKGENVFQNDTSK